MLGQDASARTVLFDALPPGIFFNLLLTLPVYAIVRRVLRPVRPEAVPEVRLLG
jgi:hypothetical protein